MFSSLGALNFTDWRLLIVSLVGLSSLRVALLVSSPEHVRNQLVRLQELLPAATTSVDLAQIRRAVLRSGKWVPGGGHCLSRALLMQALCNHYGIPCELKVGVNNESGDFRAHAWVVADGRIVMGNRADLARFHQLPDWQQAAR